jgi:hypothetical protein
LHEYDLRTIILPSSAALYGCTGEILRYLRREHYIYEDELFAIDDGKIDMFSQDRPVLLVYTEGQNPLEK